MQRRWCFPLAEGRSGSAEGSKQQRVLMSSCQPNCPDFSKAEGAAHTEVGRGLTVSWQ